MSNPTITSTSFLLLVDSATSDETVLAVGDDVSTVLAGSQRAEPQYGPDASHVTNSTRKYQCNAPLAWEPMMRKVKKQIGADTQGAAIREIMRAGLEALGYHVELGADGEEA